MQVSLGGEEDSAASSALSIDRCALRQCASVVPCFSTAKLVLELPEVSSEERQAQLPPDGDLSQVELVVISAASGHLLLPVSVSRRAIELITAVGWQLLGMASNV